MYVKFLFVGKVLASIIHRCLYRFFFTGQTEQFELKQSSVMQRLWSGLVPTSLRGDGQSADATLKVSLHPVDKTMCVFALCRDHKLRVWSCQVGSCLRI
mgnify:CR=1 FL=1